MKQSIGDECLVFSDVRMGTRENLFVDLSRVVIEGSREVGKRAKRQDEDSRIDLNICVRGVLDCLRDCKRKQNKVR